MIWGSAAADRVKWGWGKPGRARFSGKIRAMTESANPGGGTPAEQALEEQQLAARVNILPRIRSIYRWQGETREDGETLLTARTTRR